MRHRLTHHLLAALIGVAFTADLHAQTNAFTYQGFLTEIGAPVNGPTDFEFKLYDDPTAGSQQGGTMAVDDVAVSNGLFTVTLDFGGGPFDGGDRWLDIAVRPGASVGAYTNLMPRQLIASAPYAVQAANAASAASVAAGNITGTLTSAQLPATVITNGASGVNIAGTFSGDGAGVTNVSLTTLNSYGVLTWGAFAVTSSPGVGTLPVSVAAADVNGDNHVDLISANSGNSTLSVLTNNGHGGFELSASPGVGSNPRSVIAADVNNDDQMDLISANGSSTLSVLTNDGSGGFPLSSNPGVGSSPEFVIAADVNNDAQMDLISANSGSSTLSVLTNDGSGGFVSASTIGVGAFPASIAAADINSDNHVDLISANYGASTLSVLTNDGSGGFVLSSSPFVGVASRSVTTADINGDGQVDLISANSGNATLSVFTNNGGGGFVLSSNPGVGNGPVSITPADVNGDGYVDLISANINAGTLTVLTNDGGGGFVLSSSPVLGSGPYDVTTADVNGDGQQDLISANNNSSLSVLFNVPVFKGGLDATSISASSFSGSGAGLTNLNAANLVGTVADVNLSPNVALLNRPVQSFTGGTNSFAENVGIGTAAPSVPLSFGNTVGNKISFWANGNNHYGLGLQGGLLQMFADSPGSDIAFGHGSSTNLTEVMRIQGIGRVGIGTATPDKPLDVSLAAAPVATGSGSVESSLVLKLNNTQIGGTDYVPNAVGISFGRPGLSRQAIVGGTYGYDFLDFFTGGDLTNAKVRINYSGNVGIGIINPSVKLDVAGTVQATTFWGDGGSLTGLSASQLTSGTLSDARLSSNVALRAGGNTFTNNQIFNSRVGIGTTSLNATLTVANGSGDPNFELLKPGSSLGYQFFVDNNALAICERNVACGRLVIQNGTGNVGIGTSNPTNKLDVAGNASAVSFITTSDRNAKENFQPVSPAEVLTKVAALPIQQWNFKTDAGTRHIGPMAQDFYTAFGVGPDDKHIATVDADGVALAAIQGLNQKVEAQRATLEQRKTEIAELKARLERLEQLLNDKLN